MMTKKKKKCVFHRERAARRAAGQLQNDRAETAGPGLHAQHLLRILHGGDLPLPLRNPHLQLRRRYSHPAPPALLPVRHAQRLRRHVVAARRTAETPPPEPDAAQQPAQDPREQDPRDPHAVRGSAGVLPVLDSSLHHPDLDGLRCPLRLRVSDAVDQDPLPPAVVHVVLLQPHHLLLHEQKVPRRVCQGVHLPQTPSAAEGAAARAPADAAGLATQRAVQPHGVHHLGQDGHQGQLQPPV